MGLCLVKLNYDINQGPKDKIWSLLIFHSLLWLYLPLGRYKRWCGEAGRNASNISKNVVDGRQGSFMGPWENPRRGKERFSLQQFPQPMWVLPMGEKR